MTLTKMLKPDEESLRQLYRDLESFKEQMNVAIRNKVRALRNMKLLDHNLATVMHDIAELETKGVKHEPLDIENDVTVEDRMPKEGFGPGAKDAPNTEREFVL